MVRRKTNLQMNRKKALTYIENFLYPLILLIWPIVKFNQGVDISDSTYSLGNYLYPDNIQPMWKISTYLSNLIGSWLVRLPGADRLIIANIYTGLFISAIAISVYFLLRKQLGAWQVFLGEFLSIGFCWIPSGILYNYITYLLFSLGAIFLCLGIGRKSYRLLAIAGIMLGLNVFVRLPNVLEAMLIIAVWVGFKKPLKATLACICGFAAGIFAPMVLIVAREGLSAFAGMLTGLTSVSSNNDDYTFLGMIISCINAYIRSLRWLACVVIVIAIGWCLYYAAGKVAKDGNRIVAVWIPSAFYICLIGLMLRLFWGRGMFSLRYYEDYTAITEWGMMVLFLGLIIPIIDLIRKGTSHDSRIMALIVLLIILITPLGSNNYTFQNINNLFIVLPYIISRVWNILRSSDISISNRYSLGVVSVVFATVILIQTSLFHMTFVFRDGMDGTKREVMVEGIPSLQGMYTTADNARVLKGIAKVMEECRSRGVTEALYWGDCPGLSYIFRMPSAIDTTWPDLGSYDYEYMERQLIGLAASSQAENTMLILRETDNDMSAYQKKQELLMDYVRTKHLEKVYDQDGYAIYIMP